MSGYVRAVNFVKNLVKGGSKTSPTISSVKPNISTTKLEKTTSKLNIAKHKTKMSKAKLNQTLFDIDQASKKGGRVERKFGGGADLRDIPAGKKYAGLKKLPKEVRNKMKFKKNGGKI